MAKFLNALLVALGIWLIVTPFLFHGLVPAFFVTPIAGALVTLLAYLSFKQEEYKPALDFVIVVIGAALAVFGIVGLVTGLAAGLNEVFVGLIAAFLAFTATRFTETFKGATFYDRGGTPMVDVKGLRMKDGTILMNSMLLQSMPSTVYVRPDEVWKVLTMLPYDVIKEMPKFLMKGYKDVNPAKGEASK